jgi:DNA-binding Lrp family transcriptional regulator
MSLDDLDVRILELLSENPKVSGVEAAAEMGIARATYQTRLDRMSARGVASFEPQIDTTQVGYPVTAFISAEIRQSSRGHGVIDHLAAIAEVTEVHTVTGSSDLLIRAVARSNQHLQEVLDRLARHDDVLHTSTSIALANPISLRSRGLARLALEDAQATAADEGEN